MDGYSWFESRKETAVTLGYTAPLSGPCMQDPLPPQTAMPNHNLRLGKHPGLWISSKLGLKLCFSHVRSTLSIKAYWKNSY